MPLSPPTLATLRPRSHTSRLPRLVVGLPLVLRHLSISSRPASNPAVPPPLAAPPPHVVPLFIAGAVIYLPPRLFVMSPFVTPTSNSRHAITFSSYCALSRPSSALAGCHVESNAATTTQFCPFPTSPANATTTFTSASISVVILATAVPTPPFSSPLPPNSLLPIPLNILITSKKMVVEYRRSPLNFGKTKRT